MIQFFKTQSNSIIAVYSAKSLGQENVEKLNWLFSGASFNLIHFRLYSQGAIGLG